MVIHPIQLTKAIIDGVPSDDWLQAEEEICRAQEQAIDEN